MSDATSAYELSAYEEALENAVLRSDKFRLARQSDWERLDAIVTAMEKGRVKRISDEDLLALPALYRMAASSLSVARETTLDNSTLAYLDGLVRRAWFQVYGPQTSLFDWFRDYLAGDWSKAVRGIALDIWIAFAVMVAGVVVGWLLVAGDPDWYFAFVSAEMAGGRVPGASREELMAVMAGEDDAQGLAYFAAYLFDNNASVCILAFALGFAFGLPTLMLLMHNMVMLGAMLWLHWEAGLILEFSAWLSVHGTTEIFAILLAGAAGLHIGRSMAFPGNRSILSAASEAGRRGALVMVGAIIMLVAAAILEGFFRQLVGDSAGRLIIGGVMLVFWLALFLLAGREKSEAST